MAEGRRGVVQEKAGVTMEIAATILLRVGFVVVIVALTGFL
jgi:hypothetical protein